MLGDDYEAILAEARRGSSVALGAIYRDLFPSVLAYLRVRAPADAEDLTSDVFLDVARGITRFAGSEGMFRAWVFTIARRRAIDAARRRARRATDVVPAEVLEGLVGSDDPAREAVEALETADALELVRQLPKGQAEVLLLRVVAGLSTEETARALGRRPGAVRVAQHRAIRRLARMLERPDPEADDA
ncbi:MAG TPA: sigma-70 family RNA polymerase sigma factor [Acidimicrobiia bacterium]|jgi:RNA polymerase sigma-70 factor (ECF subfamily)